MIYLCLAVMSSVLVSAIMRLSESQISNKISMLLVNYGMCILLAAIHSGLTKVPGMGFAFGLGMINGIFYLGGFVLFQYNVNCNGVVLSSTFMRLGVLVSTALPIVFFGEKPEIVQILGFALAIASILMIQTDKEKSSANFKLGLLLLLLFNGCGDAMSKVFEELGNTKASEHFLFFTFIFAFIFCFLLVVKNKEKPGKAELFFGFLIGIPNFYSARFLLRALSYVPAVIAYPTQSVATIVVISLAGVILFKEKISRRQLIALGGIMCALVLLNI